MSTLLMIVQMMAIIAVLLAVAGALFYAFCWLILGLMRFFPIVGKQYRHARWDELNSTPHAGSDDTGTE